MAKRAVDPVRKAEGEALYKICSQIKSDRRIDWLGLFNNEMRLGVSRGYDKLLKRGDAGVESVATIRQWIIAHELDTANRLNAKMFPRGLQTHWQAFIEERGQYGSLFTKPYTPNQIHDISGDYPLNETRFKLGQQFTFELDSPIFGAVIALDFYKGQWYPLPLRADGRFEPISIKNGLYGFPIKDSTDHIVPMRQRSYPGEHQHCFIIGPNELMAYYAKRFVPKTSLSLDALNQMADRLSQVDHHKLAVVLENVLFE